jgi:hypothetical protein
MMQLVKSIMKAAAMHHCLFQPKFAVMEFAQSDDVMGQLLWSARSFVQSPSHRFGRGVEISHESCSGES